MSQFTCAHCGVDLDAVIGAVPEDGQDHPIRCPGCSAESFIMRQMPGEKISAGNIPEGAQ